MAEQQALELGEAGESTYGVAELNRAILGALRKAFPSEVWVRGQLQSWSDRSGLATFTLVDAASRGVQHDASLHVILMGAPRRAVERTLARAGDLRLSDGLELRVRGFVTYHPPTGRLQLRMTAIDVEHTLGRLALDRDRLVRALRADGLLERNRQRPMPVVPLRVGLVTSVASAAYHDVLSALEASGLAFTVVVADTRVQGAEAARTVPLALRRLAAARPPVDVVAVVRGGGGRGDLAAFDGEAVARAIAAMPVPVLAGIGHDVDSSVADLVAHTSCATPTAVAAALVQRVRAYVDGLGEAEGRLRRAAERHLQRAGADLDRRAGAVAGACRHTLAGADAHTLHAARRVDRATAAATAAATARLDGARDRLVGAARRHVATHDARLDGVEGRVRALDPALTLARGWTITRDGEGRILRSAAEAEEAGALVTAFADGEVRSRVDR